MPNSYVIIDHNAIPGYTLKSFTPVTYPLTSGIMAGINGDADYYFASGKGVLNREYPVKQGEAYVCFTAFEKPGENVRIKLKFVRKE